LSTDPGSINLSRLVDRRCEQVPPVFRRPLPEGAEKKQVAITIRGERTYLPGATAVGGRLNHATGAVQPPVVP
jgi:hypothetical protein